MADAQIITPPELKLALGDIQGRLGQYSQLRNYYDGKHSLAYATEKWRNAFGRVMCNFSDNLMPTVVDAVADRLELTEFAVEAIGGTKFGKDNSAAAIQERADIETAAQDIWRDNRMDAQAGEVHQEALKEGDAFVIVWPDRETGQPIIYPQRAERVTMRYDPDDPRKALWAAKVWYQDRNYRVNLYYPDRIEKWVTRKPVDSSNTALSDKPGSYVRFETPGEAWPLANDWGRVPVFQFANNACLGQWGKSELKDAIALQDALNKAVVDMMVAMEFVSLPQRYVTGLEVEIDELTGKPKFPFQPGVDRIWAAADPTVKFGEFAAADLTNFLAVTDSFRVEIARVTGTPPHYFQFISGNPPSGEALKTLEARLIKRIRDRQTTYGNAWEDVMAFCLLILGRQGVRLCAKWIDPAPRSEKEHTEALLNKRELGISEQQALRELDYTDEEIETMEAEKQANATNMGGALIRNFNRGAVGGQPDGGTVPGVAGGTTGAPAMQQQGGY